MLSNIYKKFKSHGKYNNILWKIGIFAQNFGYYFMIPFKTTQITPKEVNNQELRKLYQTAFPEDEQIPWADLMRLVEEMHLDFTVYYDVDTLIGFTIVYPPPSVNLGPGTFTMQDWDDITNELKQFWWPDDLK